MPHYLSLQDKCYFVILLNKALQDLAAKLVKFGSIPALVLLI